MKWKKFHFPKKINPHLQKNTFNNVAVFELDKKNSTSFFQKPTTIHEYVEICKNMHHYHHVEFMLNSWKKNSKTQNEKSRN